MRYKILVSFEVPDGLTQEAAVEYVESAVAEMRGSYDPEGPVFSIRGETVSATFLGIDDQD